MRFCLLIILCGIFNLVFADNMKMTIEPGQYVFQNGWHTILDIYPDDGTRGMPFSIRVQGSNGHSCFMSDDNNALISERLDNNHFNIRPKDDNKEDYPACDIEFTHISSESIIANIKYCNGWCGARAGFEEEAIYQKVDDICAFDNIMEVDSKVQQLKASASYSALEILSTPILSQCKKSLTKYEQSFLLIDLGYAQSKQNSQQCNVTLESFVEVLDGEYIQRFSYDNEEKRIPKVCDYAGMTDMLNCEYIYTEAKKSWDECKKIDMNK